VATVVGGFKIGGGVVVVEDTGGGWTGVVVVDVVVGGASGRPWQAEVPKSVNVLPAWGTNRHS
jgi:hypothetical protein